ncbi:hypothetical protein M0638_16710 [Roseomonas sp. NAR14]|uniref:Uncharacterized protein n=1 Tax=Roseomonas acroporae TaxID=2937791 RepID=A0A9X1YBQ4_9PROT|nr:hypothetical protein [Roseomonas acroporae]MCK8786020.1 hypothetical protein [Roseomonas acroporae]
MSDWMESLRPSLDPDEQELSDARTFFDRTQLGFDAAAALSPGFRTAAENLRRYRSGVGGRRDYTSEEIAQFDPLMAQEDRNRSRMERGTFVGRTRANSQVTRLSKLNDGETLAFEDGYDAAYPTSNNEAAQSLPGRLERIADTAGSIITNPATYLAFGQNNVASRGQFSARRDGNRLLIRGTVSHGFGNTERGTDSEPFDFHAGQPGGGEAATLERAGEARPFDMAYRRQQDVEAEAEYNPDGTLTLRRATWGPVR